MFTLPTTAQNIINTLQNKGFEAYAVGGSVRDTVMGIPTFGWDFTTNAPPQMILEIFPDSFYDNSFGTVGIKIYDGADKPVDIYEITTYRSEKGYSDFRHPDKIQWGTTLKEDLSRRDFTINAIATDGRTIVDPYHGMDDVREKMIRTVGVARDRLSEDALRCMRAVRIASQLGFMIEGDTLGAIRETSSLLTKISFERIRDELYKILASPHPADGVLLLKNTGLLHYILPELEACFGISQKSPKRHHIYDVGTHLVEALRACKSGDPVVRLATLLHDIGKAPTWRKDETTGIITFYNHEIIGARLIKEISQRLRLSRKDSQRLYILTRWHQFTVDERQTDSAIRRIIRRIGKENLSNMLDLRVADRLGGGARETSWRLELFKQRLEEVQIQPFSVSDLAVSGHDVMEILNVTPGPIVGKVLNALFAQVDSGTLQNDREILLKKIEDFK